MKLNEIKDQWIRVALVNTKPEDKKSLYRYLREGGLNHLQTDYLVTEWESNNL